MMAILVVAKIVALALTISSGGSGGVFAPGLFVGAMLGGVWAKLFDQPDAAFVVVGMATVFSGAARVPIATMLMVTEMTGGFQLLVPAALAITVSYVIQMKFSAWSKYRSLYEGQVEGRPDSPAHQVEHLETAVRLLAQRKVHVPETIRHIDLSTLLEAGIPVDLPENRRLLVATIQKGSDCIGRPANACFPSEAANTIDLVAVFRGTRTPHMRLPTPDTILQPDDRLLLIAEPEALEKHGRDLAM